MEFGLFLMGHHGCWEDAAFAEEHGFDSVGMVDSQLLAGETFACLALTAQATSRVRVGTFLAIPHNRSAAVTAQGVATINRLAPGRTYLAVGSGFTSRNVMGLPPVPAATVRDYAADCRRLLDREEVTISERGRERAIRFRQEGDEYLNLDDRVPVYVAADGPKGLRAVGESGADGWVTTLQRSFMMSPNAIEVFGDSLASVLEAGARGGDGFFTALSTTACVLRPGESAADPRVVERVGPCAILPFHAAADRPEIVDYFPPSWQEAYRVYQRRVLDRFDRSRLHQEVHRGHLTHLLDGEAEILTEEIIRATTLTGTAEEIVDQLGALEGAGLRNVTLNFPTRFLREAVLEVEQHLMPALPAATG
jgi:alkanesulfonate monooxygenase SsuD/methylene tetrahydromethanopterin reductase-like flavin-dependent oxidoreductase (luciferase family)